MSGFPFADDESEPPPPPDDLGRAGAKAWRDLTAGWVFDAAGLITLAQLCRSLDLEDRLQKIVAKAEKLHCRGSRMNDVEIPELGSLVRVRQQTAQLQARLKLDADDSADDTFGLDVSAKARRAARSRWDRRFSGIA